MEQILVHYDVNQIQQRLWHILDQMEIGRELHPSTKVGIKPNLVVAKPADSGATTDPRLVASLVEYLQYHGVKDISIMEGSWVGDSTKRAFEVCGYNELSQHYQVPLIDLKKDKTRRLLDGDTWIEVCTSPLEVDFLINMPVLKAHCQTKITCALKNLKGCIPDRDKRRFHTLGLHQPIALLNKLLPQHLIVVDALAGDLTFEEGGNPVAMDRIICGTDPVAIDAYAARLLGYEPWEIEYILLAEKLQVGTQDYAVQEFGTPGQVNNTRSTRIHQRLGKYVDAKDACSACYGSLLHALHRYEKKHGPWPKDQRIVIGQGYKEQRGTQVGIGSCTRGFPKHLPGCPPQALDILRFLEETTGSN